MKRPDQSSCRIQERLIFLISQPRSGSTLLQKILEGNRDISSCGEPQFMAPLLSMFDNRLTDTRYGLFYNIIALRSFLQENNFDSSLLLNAQKAYADTLYDAVLQKKQAWYFLDKSPPYVYIYPKLVEMYPHAKYIILLRNPAAVLSSYANTFAITDYNIINRYEAVMEYQYSHNHMTQGFEALCHALEHPGTNRHVIRYEHLVSDPESVVAELLNYLELEIDSSIINYGECPAENPKKKYAMGDPVTVYSKKRPDKNHADSWIEKLDSFQDRKKILAAIKQIPSGCFRRLGYSRQNVINLINQKDPIDSNRPLTVFLQNGHKAQ